MLRYLFIRLACIVMLEAIGSIFGFLILQPIIKAPKSLRRPRRFPLSDLFCLLFALTLPLGAFNALLLAGEVASYIPAVVAVILIGIVVVVWWIGSSMLSAVGVEQVSRRILFLGVLLPIAVIGSTCVMPVLIFLSFRMFAVVASNNVPYGFLYVIGMVGNALLGPAVIVIACRCGVDWVLKDCDARRPAVDRRLDSTPQAESASG